jgi:hypothetical protein
MVILNRHLQTTLIKAILKGVTRAVEGKGGQEIDL